GRRHTRFSRDWSSDVCSSDLNAQNAGAQSPPRAGWAHVQVAHFVDVQRAKRQEVTGSLGDPYVMLRQCDKGLNVLAAHAVYPSLDRKSTRLNSSHVKISYAVF